MLKMLFQPSILLPALAMALAGVLICLALVNQRLLVIRDSRFKMPVLGLAFTALVAGGFLLSLALEPAFKKIVPAVVFLVVAAGEWRRLRRRRAWAGSPPVDTVLHDVPLLKPVTTTDLVCHRYAIALPDWKGPAFRIVHVSDFHVNPKLSEAYYRQALDWAEALEPDYLFFTGDYVTRTASIPILKRVIRTVARHGDFAVLGNHDHWTDPAAIREVLERAGVRMLVNACQTVERGGFPIHLVGCDYAGYARIRIPPFPREPGLKLALCHTPDAIFALARLGAQAVFSGHNHAGQARIPWLGPLIVPSRFGRLFDHGHFVVDGAHLFVSSGVGAATPPLRFYCQPDIFAVDIRGVTAQT